MLEEAKRPIASRLIRDSESLQTCLSARQGRAGKFRMTTEKYKPVRNLSQFFTNREPSRTLAIVALTTIIVGGIFVANNRQNQPVSPEDEKRIEQQKQTRLTIQPEKIKAPLTPAKTDTFAVKINTNENNVTSVQLELSYNPETLTNVDVNPGDFFDKPLILAKSIDKEKGRITLTTAISPSGSPKMGKGTVALITFTTIQQTEARKSKIRFNKDTIVTAEGIKENVLKFTNGATVQFE